MRIAVLSPGYPTDERKYNYTFVHRRVKNYIEAGAETKVFVPKHGIELEHSFEDVNVFIGDHDSTVNAVADYNPDIVFLQAPRTKWLEIRYDMLDITLSLYDNYQIPYINWLQGIEALRKSRYYPGGKPSSFSNLQRAVRRGLHLYKLRKFLKVSDKRGFPTVLLSNWFNEAVAKSVKYHIQNVEIIPNPVDTELFSYTERNPEKVTEMLSIRPFVYRYANDMSIEAVSQLARGKLDLYGKGPLLSELRAQRDELGANVEFHPRFLTQQEITSLHEEYSLYLSPSRTDAQGVSMCEAMSSGLPVISTPTQAIPEFVTDGETGYLCETPSEMAEKISHLQDNPEEIVRMGKQASDWILENCSSEVVIEREFDLARSLI